MSAPQGWFVTGTDTGIGKTEVALALMRGLRQAGLSVVGMKPVATGGVWTRGVLVNDDAAALHAASAVAVPYADVNPYCYEPPIAPHLAAAETGRPIQPAAILAAYARLAVQGPVVVEGAGGWRVPLAPGFDMAALALALRLPVVLVVGIRLGCINHALLSADAIRGRAPWAGWVANRVDPDTLRSPEIIETLVQHLGPPLAMLPHGVGQALDAAPFLPKDAATGPT